MTVYLGDQYIIPFFDQIEPNQNDTLNISGDE